MTIFHLYSGLDVKGTNVTVPSETHQQINISKVTEAA